MAIHFAKTFLSKKSLELGELTEHSVSERYQFNQSALLRPPNGRAVLSKIATSAYPAISQKSRCLDPVCLSTAWYDNQKLLIGRGVYIEFSHGIVPVSLNTNPRGYNRSELRERAVRMWPCGSFFSFFFFLDDTPKEQ